MVDTNTLVDRWVMQVPIPEGGYVNFYVPKHITPQSLEAIKQIMALQMTVFEAEAAKNYAGGHLER